MDFRELRSQTGLSQSKFAKLLDIPVSTLQNWEEGVRKPPKYIYSMIRRLLIYEGYLKGDRSIIARYDVYDFLKDSKPHSDRYDVDIDWIFDGTNHGVHFIYEGEEFTSYIEGIGDIPDRKDFYERAAVYETERILEMNDLRRKSLERRRNEALLSDA